MKLCSEFRVYSSMNASSNVVLTNLNASTCVRRPQDLDSCPGVRKLLTRRPDERVGPMPAYLKEQFLEGQKNACQILQEYCQIRRLTLSYEASRFRIIIEKTQCDS